MKVCARCAHEFGDVLIGPCPTCGYDQPLAPAMPQPVQSAFSWIQAYFSDLKKILTQPSEFFRTMPLSDGFSRPLTFALVTHWIGSASSYLWKSTLGSSFSHYFKSLIQIAGDISESDPFERAQTLENLQQHVMPWIVGTGSVLLDPFTTLFSILFLSLFVYAGARILVDPEKNGSPRQIPYESAVRIICYSSAASLFSIIPIVGPFFSTVLSIIISIIGAKTVYRVSATRATVIALFPNLLLFGMIMAGVAALVVFIVKIFTSVF